MRKIKIISFGNHKYEFIKNGINHYLEKLKYYCKIEFIVLEEITNSKNDINTQLKEEVKLIKKYISSNDKVFLLDISGKLINSEEFSKIININNSLCFVIGSSNGFDKEFKTNYPLISFGKITLPHKLFKIILLEQIYRGFNIINKTKYHK